MIKPLRLLQLFAIGFGLVAVVSMILGLFAFIGSEGLGVKYPVFTSVCGVIFLDCAALDWVLWMAFICPFINKEQSR